MKKLTTLLLTLALALSLAPAALAAEQPTAQEALDALEQFISSGEIKKDLGTDPIRDFVFKNAYYVDFDADGVPELVRIRYWEGYTQTIMEVYRVVKMNGACTISGTNAEFDRHSGHGDFDFSLIRYNDGTYGVQTHITPPPAYYEEGANYYAYCAYADGQFYDIVEKPYTKVSDNPSNRFAYYTAPAATPVPAAQKIAYASTQDVELDGKKVSFQAYALKDPATGYLTNYVKLRDVAFALNGTAAQFAVGWDGAVNIVTGQSYAANGSENKTPFSGDRAYADFTGETRVNGRKVDLSAITLTDNNGNGYTYYKLRDLGEKLGFLVDWTAERGIIVSTTGSVDPTPVADTPKSTLPDGEYTIHLFGGLETVSGGKLISAKIVKPTDREDPSGAIAYRETGETGKLYFPDTQEITGYFPAEITYPNIGALLAERSYLMESTVDTIKVTIQNGAVTFCMVYYHP